MMHSWGIPGLLKIHLKIDQVNHNLYMTLWLHITAHNAKTYPWFSIFCYKCWDDCMKWPFPWCIYIAVALLKSEHLSPVLEDKTQAGRTHT